MTFGRAIIGVIFSCPKCTLLYVAMQERRPDKIAGRFDCIDCGEMIHAWSGAHDYPIWRIFPDTETLAGERCRADVSITKDRQCRGSRKETSRD